MASAPRVSVLMAIFNASAYLAEAIESILAQTLTDFELILIDDGSTDDCAALIREFAARDSRIVWEFQENRGVSAATNRALHLARAPYVAILDSDDRMMPERLAMQAAYLDEHPDITAIGSQWFTMDTDSRINGLDRHAQSAHDARHLMFNYFTCHHPTMMARRAAILAIGGYATDRPYGALDYDLFSRLTVLGHRLANLPVVLTSWRINPGGITQGKARFQTEQCIAIRDRDFAALAAQDPHEADEIALSLVRTYPAGSWFDDKAARLVPDPPPSPALVRWRDLAARDRVPPLEKAIVAWLHDEPDCAHALATELKRSDLPWLEQLVLAHAAEAAVPPPPIAGMALDPDAGATLTVLVPTHAPDTDLASRIAHALETVPADSEVVVFATDGEPVAAHALPADVRVRTLPATSGKDAWPQALAASRGRCLAFLEERARHHPAFLSEAVASLEARRDRALIVTPTDLFYPDASNADGTPARDPTPEPRWTRATLLGRDRTHLGALVVRRDALAELPLRIEETGSATAWCIARGLLTRFPPEIVERRSTVFGAPVALGNNVLQTLTRRLVSWYLDTAMGHIPKQAAWPRLTRAQAGARLRAMDTQLEAGAFCIHPGNRDLILQFTSRISPMTIGGSASFHHLLRERPAHMARTLSDAGRGWLRPLIPLWLAHDRLKRRLRATSRAAHDAATGPRR